MLKSFLIEQQLINKFNERNQKEYEFTLQKEAEFNHRRQLGKEKEVERLNKLESLEVQKQEKIAKRKQEAQDAEERFIARKTEQDQEFIEKYKLFEKDRQIKLNKAKQITEQIEREKLEKFEVKKVHDFEREKRKKQLKQEIEFQRIQEKKEWEENRQLKLLHLRKNFEQENELKRKNSEERQAIIEVKLQELKEIQEKEQLEMKEKHEKKYEHIKENLEKIHLDFEIKKEHYIEKQKDLEVKFQENQSARELDHKKKIIVDDLQRKKAYLASLSKMNLKEIQTLEKVQKFDVRIQNAEKQKLELQKYQMINQQKKRDLEFQKEKILQSRAQLMRKLHGSFDEAELRKLASDNKLDFDEIKLEVEQMNLRGGSRTSIFPSISTRPHSQFETRSTTDPI